MNLIVYADFNCPYSCLASARADALIDLGLAEVEWRAVEHDPTIPRPSEPVEGEVLAMLDREVAQVRGLVVPGETFPIERPPVHPNTSMAVAAYAASPAAARRDLRRRLFAALWFEGRDTGDPAVVQDLRVGPSETAVQLVATWRDAWLALERPLVPMLVLPDGYVSRGLGALARLADLVTTPRRESRPPPAVT
jgi:hypothetical protein